MIDGTSSDYPSRGCHIRCVCLLVFNPALLKLCTVYSLHYRLQQEVEDRSSGTRETAGHWPGLCVLPRPVISFARWTSLDVAKHHLTFRSSLNQADDQEQVQTAHIMQTFYKVVSIQAWLHVFLCICRTVLWGIMRAESHSVDRTTLTQKSTLHWGTVFQGVSKWALQGSVEKKMLKCTEFYVIMVSFWSTVYGLVEHHSLITKHFHSIDSLMFLFSFIHLNNSNAPP